MKKFTYLTLSALIVLVMGGCAKATPEHAEEMIQSGNEIDGMMFANVDDLNWDISLVFLCNQEPVEETDTSTTLKCSTLPGSSLFFGNCGGILYETLQEADEKWQDFEIEISFDGRVVDLPSFGYLDTEYPEDPSQNLRMWNLRVENISPGTHTVQCVQENEDEEITGIFVFEVTEKQEGYPALSSGAIPRIHPYTTEDGKVNYLLYVPDDYDANSGKKWPLLIFLHGRSRVYGDVKSLEDDYPLNTLTEDGSFPFVVLAPKSKIDPNIGGDYDQWASDYQVQVAMTAFDEVQAELSIDPNRVYLTGGSGGGNGVWVISTSYTDRFAALVPFMGYYGWPFTVPENICGIKDIPVWAFHGDADEVVPLEAEQSIVDALKACGGEVQFTVFPDVGHDLNAELVYNSELYTWLLEQRRGMPPTATPTAVPPTATPTEIPPTVTPTQTFTLISAVEEILGTWQAGNYYIRFNEDGSFRQSHALETLDSQPYAISSYEFEGEKMITVEISVAGVPTCGNQAGSYELQLLENGNLQILVIEDRCTGRAHDTAGTYEPVR